MFLNHADSQLWNFKTICRIHSLLIVLSGSMLHLCVVGNHVCQSSESNAPFVQRCFTELRRIRWRRSDTQSVWAAVHIVGITENIRNSCHWLHCLTVSAWENVAVLFLIALNVLNVNSFLVPLHWQTLIDHMIWPKSCWHNMLTKCSFLAVNSVQVRPVYWVFYGHFIVFFIQICWIGGSASLCWGQSRILSSEAILLFTLMFIYIYLKKKHNIFQQEWPSPNCGQKPQELKRFLEFSTTSFRSLHMARV